MKQQRPVVVVGAGVSGLTAAFWLHRAGIDVRVLEREEWPGGTMRTVRDDDWLVETGPNSALETTPLFGQMFDLLGITGDRLYANAAGDKRYIVRSGRLHPLPMSPLAFVRSRLWSPPGKMRLLKEPFIGRATKEESVAEFVERRLGREFLDYAINPFVAGVYAGNPEQLSVRSAFPKLYALEEKYGGLIRGMIMGARERRRRAEKAKDRARMFSFKHGMQTFPDALARSLGDRVLTGTTVHSIEKKARGSEGYAVTFRSRGAVSRMDADSVILAVPSDVAGDMIRPSSPALAARLANIYYPPVAEVFLGFRDSQIGQSLDGFGYLVPAVEGRKILGTIWSSALFPNRAPAGHVALTTFVGGSRQPELLTHDDNKLRDLVVEEVRKLMNVQGGPSYTRVIRWERAIPQYNLGHHALIEAVERFENDNRGFYFCSNFRGGIAVGDCVMSGERVAQRVIAGLREHEHKY